jgi:Glycosyl hydrolases family 2/Glycosyl hydrolases family 2, TIM barrel domain/Glycosyl hydrolases family 2, sugar binding domain
MVNAVLAAVAFVALPNPAYVWLEGEVPSTANVKFEGAGWGRQDFLSQKALGQLNLSPEDVATKLPDGGGLLTYEFQAPGTGKHEIWDRIGFEFVRSPFEWRVDNGNWATIRPSDLTTDMQEFSTWNEIAWIKLGDVNLESGKHTLQIRLPKTKDAKGNWEKVLYASDALVITNGTFKPNGKFRPDETYQTADDQAAAAKSFTVADRPGPERQTVPLNGLWQIARDDEQLPGRVDAPIDHAPNSDFWYGIPVPADRNVARPELTMAHRFWYRTRIEVPASQLGRSFHLTFRQNSLNTTVYVNGKLCGFNRNPFVDWDCDITNAVKVGENTVEVGIRDAWYGFKSSPTDPMVLRQSFVIPLAFERQGFSKLDYPVWGCFKSGMLATPSLTVSGPVRSEDIFVQPIVTPKKSLKVDLTLRNPSTKERTVSVQYDLLDNNKPIWHLNGTTQPLKPGDTVNLSQEAVCPDAPLWWPNSPKMLTLRTTVSENGQPIDIQNTPFGFRQWTWQGPTVRLNGVVWHGWAQLMSGDTREEYLKNYRDAGQRFARMAGAAQNSGVYWNGMAYPDALDWCDQNGVVIRRCGPLDGEAIGYNAIEENGPGINQTLLDNVRQQILAQIKPERNHPSVNVWSVENEWLYINCINLYGDRMDAFEKDMAGTLDAMQKLDPTRLVMTDGGGSGKNNEFPVHGDHYVYTNDPAAYPDLAYTDQVDGGGRGRWRWDRNRPRYAGEDYFASGINPADYAWIQGETAFQGKTEAQKGMALVQRMITEGYRWRGAFTAFHLWLGDEGKQFGKNIANADRAAFVRQYDWTFGSGQTVKRTVGIFNDSPDSTPLTFTWTLVAGKSTTSGKSVHNVAPGTSEKFDLALPMPRVTQRTEATLTLTLHTGATKVFQDPIAVSILPDVKSTPKTGVALFDPQNSLTIPGATNLKSLAVIPANVTTLIVGRNALDATTSTSTALAAFASTGHRVIVLEQANPLKYQALPAEVESTTASGSFAFPEDATHPVLKGLQAKDFVYWPDRGKVYENAYAKPIRGAKSIIQCGSRLGNSALVEVPVRDGLLLLCQMNVAGNLKSSAAARTLLSNLIQYAQTYRQVFLPVTAVTQDPLLAQSLNAIGVKHTEATDPVAALTPPGARIAVISATPANLKSLAANLPKVNAFTAAGGSIVFHGLTPDGLADYNRIVGVDHLIRPFRREKVSLATPKNHLAAGLSLGDVVMLSSERMFDFNDDMYVASDIFSNVVDLDDDAPFAKLENDYLYNTTNGFVSGDGWKYIFSFDLKTQKPEYTMTYPKPRPFRELTWIGNGFYHKVTKIALVFDGKDTVTYDVAPKIDPQTLAISPVRTAKTVELKILDWTKNDGAGGEVVGIDNIFLRIARDDAYQKTVRPILNIGGLVEYDKAPGRIVLCNLKFQAQESVPINAQKKRTILSAILRNLGAAFDGGGRTVIAGAAGNQYVPIDVAKQANQFRNEKGWFGEPNYSFKDLPTGKQTFGGVPFTVYEFPTSPVPNAIVLGGDRVPNNLKDKVEGIPVGQKASALFFLQAARIDQPINEWEARDGKRFEIARYRIRYADGQEATVPLFLGIDTDSYRQTTPRALPGAQIGWTKPYGDGQTAVAYVKQWTNPRPEVAIQSVTLEYGPDRRGIPALLAVTAVR